MGATARRRLNGGWPAYEFSDGSATFSGILRNANGEPAIRLYAHERSGRPNRLTVEFQDEFNEYQQDSLSLVDVDDALLTEREVTATFRGRWGCRISIRRRGCCICSWISRLSGNTFVEFSDDGEGRRDCAGRSDHGHVSEGRAGRQPFRVVKIGAGANYQTRADHGAMARRRLVHDGRRQYAAGGGRTGARVWDCRGLWWGACWTRNGIEQFGITETVIPRGGGQFAVKLSVAFVPPALPAASARRFRW